MKGDSADVPVSAPRRTQLFLLPYPSTSLLRLLTASAPPASPPAQSSRRVPVPWKSCRSPLAENRKYSTAAFGSLAPSFKPYVVSFQPGTDLYSGVTRSYSSASAGISFSGVPLYLYPTQT